MDPAELVRLIDILNPENRAGRITIITRMGPENMRVKLLHLICAVRGAGQIVTWVTDPMHGNTMKAPCGLKTRSFDRILVFFPYNPTLYSIFLFNLASLQLISSNKIDSSKGKFHSIMKIVQIIHVFIQFKHFFGIRDLFH
jgi:hypothetical protein